MPAPINQYSAASNSKILFEQVKGSILNQIQQQASYPSGNTIRDKNINLFLQGQYDSKRLTQMFQNYIILNQNITVDSDTSNIDNAVQIAFPTIFDIQLA